MPNRGAVSHLVVDWLTAVALRVLDIPGTGGLNKAFRPPVLGIN